MLLLIVLAALIVGGYLLVKVRAKTAAATAAAAASAAANRTIPVLTAEVTQRDVPVMLEGLGNVSAFYTVTVKSQVGGRIDRVAFKEGQPSRRGTCSSRSTRGPSPSSSSPPRRRSRGTRPTSRTRKLNADRYKTLSEQNLIAVQQYTDQQAAVDQLVAKIASDRTQIDAAKLNLDYAHITSPIDGVTGVRLVDPGNFVQPSDTTGLVVVTQLNPIAVIFTLPEDDLPPINEAMAAGDLPWRR